ncbi:hypothetical protein F5Y18DRAFT_72936 [Xylariaceae sp. FL1019]|nr:hypothetical protein F5Y18DRAFT_72936 [Xylariaceae sp. FL1019]
MAPQSTGRWSLLLLSLCMVVYKGISLSLQQLCPFYHLQHGATEHTPSTLRYSSQLPFSLQVVPCSSVKMAPTFRGISSQQINPTCPALGTVLNPPAAGQPTGGQLIYKCETGTRCVDTNDPTQIANALATLQGYRARLATLGTLPVNYHETLHSQFAAGGQNFPCTLDIRANGVTPPGGAFVGFPATALDPALAAFGDLIPVDYKTKPVMGTVSTTLTANGVQLVKMQWTVAGVV